MLVKDLHCILKHSGWCVNFESEEVNIRSEDNNETVAKLHMVDTVDAQAIKFTYCFWIAHGVYYLILFA